jgi:hypothetical protein
MGAEPNIRSPRNRRTIEVMAEAVFAKYDIGTRLNTMFLILEKRCMYVVNKAGIIETKYMESVYGTFMDVKYITEISQRPKYGIGNTAKYVFL